MNRYRLFFVVIALFLTACNEKKETLENNMTVFEQNLTKEHKIQKEEPKEKDLLGEMGFDFKDDKIIIDINKTSGFFAKIESEMKAKAKEIESKIVKSDINMTRDMGIELKGNQIGVDLNKTQNMLQQINVLMKDIFSDINSSQY